MYKKTTHIILQKSHKKKSTNQTDKKSTQIILQKNLPTKHPTHPQQKHQKKSTNQTDKNSTKKTGKEIYHPNRQQIYKNHCTKNLRTSFYKKALKKNPTNQTDKKSTQIIVQKNYAHHSTKKP